MRVRILKLTVGIELLFQVSIIGRLHDPDRNAIIKAEKFHIWTTARRNATWNEKAEVGFSEWNSFWIDTLHQQTFQSSCRSSGQKEPLPLAPLFDSADLSILAANDFGITTLGISKEYGHVLDAWMARASAVIASPILLVYSPKYIENVGLMGYRTIPLKANR